MALPDAEQLRALTPTVVLLLLVLALGYAWIRDRNARIADLRLQVSEWREAHRISETARGLDREGTREMLEAVRTNNALLTGLREAMGRADRET